MASEKAKNNPTKTDPLFYDHPDHDRTAELQAYPIELGQLAKETQAELLESPADFEITLKEELEARRLTPTPSHVKKLLRELTNATRKNQLRNDRMRVLWDSIYGTDVPALRLSPPAP